MNAYSLNKSKFTPFFYLLHSKWLKPVSSEKQSNLAGLWINRADFSVVAAESLRYSHARPDKEDNVSCKAHTKLPYRAMLLCIISL